MADYFGHWIDIGAKAGTGAPKLYCVNWFRKNSQGKFVWPGFGDNMRVLKWIIERVEAKASAQQTALGNIPDYSNLDWSGSTFAAETFKAITTVDQSQWQQELKLHDELLAKLDHGLPQALTERRSALETALA